MANQEKENDSGASKTDDKNDEIKEELLAQRGREVITRAEGLMPGLMECRRRYGMVQPLLGARIAGCSILDAKTAVLIETLIALGAEVQWNNNSELNYKDDENAVAAALKQANISIHPKGNTLLLTLNFRLGINANILFDEGGILTDYSCGLHVFLDGIVETSQWGIAKLQERCKLRILPTSAIDGYRLLENAKAMFCNYFSCEKSLVQHIKEFNDKMPASHNVCVVFGYLNWSKNCARALRYAGVTVKITEYNSVHALEAEKDGFERVTLEEAYGLAMVYVIGMDYPKIDDYIIMKMKEGSLLCTITCCDSNVIYWRNPASRYRSSDGYLAKYQLENGKSVHILEYAKKCLKRDSPFAISYSNTLQLLAVIELWKNKDKYADEKDRKVLNELNKLEAKAAQFHLTMAPSGLAKFVSIDKHPNNRILRLPCFSSSMCE